MYSLNKKLVLHTIYSAMLMRFLIKPWSILSTPIRYINFSKYNEEVWDVLTYML